MNQEQLSVYVLIVNWNSGADTIACLSSLRKQTYTNYTVLVIDNASSDDSIDLIARAYPDVPLRRLPQNLGFTGANNVGFALALAEEAQFVYLLNADTTVAPDFLSEAVKTTTSDTSIGIVGSKVLHADRPDRLQFAGARVNLSTGYSGRPFGYDEADHGQCDYISDVDRVTGCAMLISRACIQAIGGFDNAFFAFYEDVDICLRARAAGFRVVMSPKSKIWHKGGGSLGDTMSENHMYYTVRNGLQLVNKHQPANHRLLGVLRGGCIIGAHLGQVLVNGPKWSAVCGIASGVWDYYRGITNARPATLDQ